MTLHRAVGRYWRGGTQDIYNGKKRCEKCSAAILNGGNEVRWLDNEKWGMDQACPLWQIGDTALDRNNYWHSVLWTIVRMQQVSWHNWALLLKVNTLILGGVSICSHLALAHTNHTNLGLFFFFSWASNEHMDVCQNCQLVLQDVLPLYKPQRIFSLNFASQWESPSGADQEPIKNAWICITHFHPGPYSQTHMHTACSGVPYPHQNKTLLRLHWPKQTYPHTHMHTQIHSCLSYSKYASGGYFRED